MNTAQVGAMDAPIISIQDHLAATRPKGVRVHVIGSMRVQHGRLPIQSLGGPKAGTNQALALFAFLFDRGGQGVEKDEAVEVIWPDSTIGVADTAFHRTLLGLRGTLRAGGIGDAVEFRAGRYVLASGLVSWSDLWELERMVEASASVADPAARIEVLEGCRQLNRADYMDDCPFYGTSVYVESRRALLRSVRHAVLVELAELYAAKGHHALSTMRRAEADGLDALVDRAS